MGGRASGCLAVAGWIFEARCVRAPLLAFSDRSHESGWATRSNGPSSLGKHWFWSSSRNYSRHPWRSRYAPPSAFAFAILQTQSRSDVRDPATLHFNALW